ncbi:MAG: hypothetical protein ACLGXA_01260 [Acidobacteriota bacterium]
MSQIPPDPDYSIHTELVVVDDIAAQALRAVDPGIMEVFTIVHGAPRTADVHVSILLSGDARQADALATRLAHQRLLVFTIFLADTSQQGLSGPYIVCSRRPQHLGPLLAALDRLFSKDSLVGLDFTDFAPLFRTRGEISFIDRAVSPGTSITQAGNEIGSLLSANGQLPSPLVLVIAFGEAFRDDENNEPSLLMLERALESIVDPDGDDSHDEVWCAFFRTQSSHDFLISVFHAGRR